MAKGDILIVGKGSREYAFVWKLRQSKHVKQIYVAPGNAGTSDIAKNITIENIDDLCRFALEKEIELTIVGPEIPLKLAIVDVFRKNGLDIFGPTAAAAMIETSKLYAKRLMVQKNIPTASFSAFDSYQKAYAHVHQREYPLVVKADGLAGGKGAYVCKDTDAAIDALNDLMVNRIHGTAGDKIIIEDFLQGKEISIHALCHNTASVSLLTARDTKTLKGKNTGGMGAFAPVPRFTILDMLHVEQTIVKPVLNVLNRRKTPFTGCLYPGLVLTANGPYVLEFNARFGDPETQVLMALMESDLFLLIQAWTRKESIRPIFKKNQHAVCVVLCSKEYPLSINNPVPIYGIEEAEQLSDVMIFHGATKLINGQLYTNGGRILSIVAIGESIEIARIRVYQACDHIQFHGKQYRSDIAE